MEKIMMALLLVLVLGNNFVQLYEIRRVHRKERQLMNDAQKRRPERRGGEKVDFKEAKNPFKPVVVEVDGEKVFTADFIFTQMGAQDRRIDRSSVIAFIACSISLLNLVLFLFI